LAACLDRNDSRRCLVRSGRRLHEIVRRLTRTCLQKKLNLPTFVMRRKSKYYYFRTKAQHYGPLPGTPGTKKFRAAYAHYLAQARQDALALAWAAWYQEFGPTLMPEAEFRLRWHQGWRPTRVSIKILNMIRNAEAIWQVPTELGDSDTA
jgi:hypothetical protein